MKANEERRHNPEIRAEVERVYASRKEAFVAAMPLLTEAMNILTDVPYYGRVNSDMDVARLCGAAYNLSSSIPRVVVNDTFVGNEAAFELGAEIEENLKKEDNNA